MKNLLFSLALISIALTSCGGGENTEENPDTMLEKVSEVENAEQPMDKEAGFSEDNYFVYEGEEYRGGFFPGMDDFVGVQNETLVLRYKFFKNGNEEADFLGMVIGNVPYKVGSYDIVKQGITFNTSGMILGEAESGIIEITEIDGSKIKGQITDLKIKSAINDGKEMKIEKINFFFDMSIIGG